ncbi:MAG TPA: type II toxin-antitoxin system PemK/MazF family toxin [Chthoniobacterales bacterium]|nr:type II toxin-antitoxin system PemK/MazF family toxin [Chthoniobacterales bacterium]
MITKINSFEVWLADFGFIGKIRPVLILSIPQENDARNLVVVLPLTSQIRGLRGEVNIGKPKWLPKQSAVNIQGIASIDANKLVRKMGKLTDSQITNIKEKLCEYLSL